MLKASTKLYIWVIIMSVFIIGIGGFGVMQLNTMAQNTEALYEDEVLSLKQLTTMRYLYIHGVLNTIQKYETNKISQPEAKINMQKAEEALIDSWIAYTHSPLSGDEEKLVIETEIIYKRTIENLNILIKALELNNPVKNKLIIIPELFSSVETMISKITALIGIQVDISSAINLKNQNIYSQTKTEFVIIVLITLVVAISFSIYIIKGIKILIINLRASNKKITESETKFRSFIEHAGDAIFMLNSDLSISDVNDYACKFLGYSKAELLQMRITDMVTFAKTEQDDLISDSLRETQGALFYGSFKRKDGTLVETEINNSMLEGIGFIAIVRDLTERRKAETAIKESEEKYKYLFQNNPSYIIIWDLETLDVLEVNNTVIENYGYTKEEWEVMKVTDFRPIEEEQQIVEFAAYMLNNDEMIQKRAWRHVKKNGDIMHMQIASHRIIYNQRPAILSLAHDITQQLEAEIELRQSEEKYRSLIEHAADAIFIVDNTGIIQDVNLSATDLLYYNRDELIGRSVLDLHPSEDVGKIPYLWDQLKEVKSLADERQLQRKDGTLVDVEISRKMLPDSTGAIAIVRDITERSRIQEQLEEQRKQLELFIKHSPASLAMFDTDMKYITVSERWMSDYNIGNQQIIGKTHYEVFPEITEEWKEIHRRCINGQVEKNEEDFFQRADGTVDWIRWEIRPWHKASGEVGGIIMFTEVITERKKATELFKYQFKNSPDTIFIVNRDFNIELINRTNQGTSVKEMIGTNCILMIPEEGRLYAQQALNEVFATGEPKEIELSLFLGRRSKSQIVPIMVNEMVSQLMIFSTDITERRKAEDELIKSERRNRALIENIYDVIVLINEKSEVVYQSPSYIRGAGFSMEELSGRTVLEFIHTEDSQRYKDFIKQSYSFPGLPIQGQFRLLHKRGHYIWVEGTITNLLHDENIQAFIVNYRDITERKKFEEQQALSASIVNSTDDAVISKSLDGIVRSWNRGAERVLGYTSAEMIGKNISKLVPPHLANEESEITAKIIEGRSVDHYETKRMRNDGEIVDVSITISPIKDMTGNIVGASKIMRDITEKNLYEQKLAKAAIKAQEEERYEIGGELHDNICQILATSTIYLGMMKRKLPPELESQYTNVHKNIVLASQEIRSLSHRLAPAFFDNQTFEDAVNALLTNYNLESKYDIRFIYDDYFKDNSLNRELQLNIYRILQEQVRNIMKHANATRIEIALRRNNEMLQMRIADDGDGFDLNDKIAGIGLANMNRRAKLFSGNFNIISEKGKGCEVLVEIPLTEDVENI